MSEYIFELPDSQGAYGSYGWPYKKTPHFNTARMVSAANRAPAAFSWTPWPLWDYDIALPYIYGNESGPSGYTQYLIDFFAAVKGSFDTWLFADPFPAPQNVNTVPLASPTRFGTGDGAAKVFQMQRQIGRRRSTSCRTSTAAIRRRSS